MKMKDNKRKTNYIQLTASIIKCKDIKNSKNIYLNKGLILEVLYFKTIKTDSVVYVKYKGKKIFIRSIYFRRLSEKESSVYNKNALLLNPDKIFIKDSYVKKELHPKTLIFIDGFKKINLGSKVNVWLPTFTFFDEVLLLPYDSFILLEWSEDLLYINREVNMELLKNYLNKQN